MKYSNPRMFAEIDNWPSGSHRTKAIFEIEIHPKRGQRAIRVTFHPITGKPAAPKKLTYALKMRIVDGDDGRTYIAELTRHGAVNIMKGDMKLQHEYVGSDDPRIPELSKLFDNEDSKAGIVDDVPAGSKRMQDGTIR